MSIFFFQIIKVFFIYYFNRLSYCQQSIFHTETVGKCEKEYWGKVTAAFPVDDVGLQNAIKRQLRLSTKPSIK